MKLKRLIEPVLVTLIIATAGAVNFWHVIQSYLLKPAGTDFIGISHYYQDYFYYVSQVTQGMQGDWLVRNLFTTESIPATPLWLVNLLIGKVAVIAHLTAWTAYDLSVILISLVSLYLTYFAIRRLYPEDKLIRIGAFATAVFSTCFYFVIKNLSGTSAIKPVDYFYSYTLSLNRLGGVFHLMLQNILSLVAILTFAEILGKVMVKPKPGFILKPTLIFTFSMFILMFINPEYVAVDLVAITITSLGYLIYRPNLKKTATLATVAAITSALLVIPSIIIIKTFNYPFYQYFRIWENSIMTIPAAKFFLSMGPILFFITLGIVPFIKKFTPLRILGLIWIVIPPALYFTDIPRHLGLPYFRLMQPPNYVIIGALAAEGMILIATIFSKIIRKNITGILFCLILLVYLSYQFPMIKHEVELRQSGVMINSWLNYPDKPLIEGLNVLKNYPHHKNVIAFNLLETLVPAVSGQTVYTGHESLTINYGGKIGAATRFFTCVMKPNEAFEFLNTNNIGYVLWKKADGGISRYQSAYPFLKLAYENASLAIFTVGDGGQTY
jgi:hypothetical protein